MRENLRRGLLNQVFKALDSGHAHFFGGWFSPDKHGFFGKGVDALTVFGSRLNDGFHAHDAGDRKLTGAIFAELFRNEVGKGVEHAFGGFLINLGILGQFGDSLNLGQTFWGVFFRHLIPPNGYATSAFGDS